jgi:hypothetical protein
MGRLKADSVADATDAVDEMERAVFHLRSATAAAALADAPMLLKKLKGIKKSAAGALNHARHRLSRTKRNRPMNRRGA